MKKLNKKGSITLYIVFIFTAIFVILITAVLAPMGTRFSAEAYAFGEQMILEANESLSNIQNVTVRNELIGIFDEAQASTEFNIEVTTDLFQYSWVFVIIIVGLVIWLISRAMVERSTMYGGGFI